MRAASLFPSIPTRIEDNFVKCVVWFIALGIVFEGLTAKQLAYSQSADLPRLALQTGHTRRIHSIIWCQNERWIITLGDDDSIRLWNAQTGHQMRTATLNTFEGAIASNDGRWIAAAGKAGVHIWDLQHWQLLLTSSLTDTYPLVFTKDSRWLVLGSTKPDITVWNTATWKYEYAIHADDGARATAAAVTKKGDILLVMEKTVCDFVQGRFICKTSKSEIDIFDIQRRGLKKFADVPAGERLKSISVSQLGSLFALTQSSKLLKYNSQTGELQSSITTNMFSIAESLSFAVAPDDKYAVVFDWDQWELLDLNTNKHLLKRCEAIAVCWDINSAAFASNGALALGQNTDLAISESASSLARVRQFRSTVDTVADISFSKDGHWLTFALSDMAFREAPTFKDQTERNHSAVRIWGFRDEDAVYSIRTHDTRSDLVGFSGDRDDIVFIDGNELLKVGIGNNMPVTIFKGSWIWSGRHDPQNMSYALADVGKGIRIVDPASGKLKSSFNVAASPEQLGGFAISARYCAVAVPAGPSTYSIEMHALKTGNLVGKFSIYDPNIAPPAGSVHMAFLPDDTALIVGWGGGVARWKLRSKRTDTTLEVVDPEMEVIDDRVRPTALAISTTGRFLAYGDTEITLVDLKTRQIRQLKNTMAEIRALSFAPDDRWLASAGIEGGVRLWETSTGDLRATLVPIREASDWLVVTPDGLFDGTANAMHQVSWWINEASDTVPLDDFYSDFYYPGLLNEILSGGHPAASVDIATMLQIPGLRMMLAEKDAHLEIRGSALLVCFAQIPGVAVQSPIGMQRDLPTLEIHGFRVDPDDKTCRYKKELLTSSNPQQLIRKLQNSKPQRAVSRWDGQSTTAAGATVHVFAVGIADYPPASGLARVGYADVSAKAVSDFFTKRNAAIKGTHTDFRIWRPLYNHEATRAAIQMTLSDIANASKANDIVFLYIAGHGSVHSNQEMFYFIPADAKRASNDDNDDDFAPDTAVSTAMLADALRSMPARRIVLIIDACQSGGALEALSRVADAKIRIEQQRSVHTKGATMPAGIQIIAATLPLSYAAGTSGQLSTLAEVLLDILHRPEASSARSIARLIKTNVPTISEETIHFRQVPLISSVGADFPIVPQ